jgi:hypothetical protein
VNVATTTIIIIPTVFTITIDAATYTTTSITANVNTASITNFTTNTATTSSITDNVADASLLLCIFVTGFSFRFHVELTQMGPIERASLFGYGDRNWLFLLGPSELIPHEDGDRTQIFQTNLLGLSIPAILRWLYSNARLLSKHTGNTVNVFIRSIVSNKRNQKN